MKVFNRYFLTIMIVSVMILSGCSKLLEIDPPKNQLTTDKVFTDSISVYSVMGNVYYLLSDILYGNYNKHISLYTDELAYTSQNNDFFVGNIPVDNGTSSNIWSYFYEIVYACNDIIENIENTDELSDEIKAIFINESKFIRAFCYYHLYNLFENIPLVLTTNVGENRLKSQADSAEVFNQIIVDLKESKDKLPSNYSDGEKVRASKWAATALLAQVYLYQGRWEDAFLESNAVITSGYFNLSPDIENAFLSNSDETIFQLWNVDGYIRDVSSLIPQTNAVLPQYIVTESLLNAFEPGDLRKNIWIGLSQVNNNSEVERYSYPYKYKNRNMSGASSEYLIVSRLSEMMLTRAECKIHLNDIPGAIEDLNAIRKRAGLMELPSSISESDCLLAVYEERRVELFNEWGNRFVDLKRTGRIDSVMEAYKSTWVTGKSKRLPIPFSELLYNINLKQNEGYND